MADQAMTVPSNGSQASRAPGPPVFVLCNGRSGSTLLRFLLDAHPQLACPPETNLPAMAAQLATVWSLIEGAPLSAERGDEPPVIPDAAIAGVRRTMDEMTGSYLARRGKKRYLRQEPGHGAIRRVAAAGLSGGEVPVPVPAPDGRDRVGYRGLPVGPERLWLRLLHREHARQRGVGAGQVLAGRCRRDLAAEEKFASSCHRVRYEDLVADPEAVTAGIFEFLGVPPDPGISGRCFSPERERFGPADYKIWHTSQISGSSVGRGWSVPAAMIPPQEKQALTELTDKLGYLSVDDEWGTAGVPADLRVAGSHRLACGPGSVERPESAIVGDRLEAGLPRADSGFSRRWGACSGEAFMIVATPPAGAGAARESRWRVDLAAGTVTHVPTAAGDDTAFDVVGSVDAWQAVLGGHTNLGVAMRRCELRYCDTGDAGPVVADLRIDMLADLLGLAPSWQVMPRRADLPLADVR